MAHVETNTDVIRGWMRDKQRNEQAMLFRLNNWFRRPIPRRKIRGVVTAAFQKMAGEAVSGPIAAVRDAVQKEADLSVWRKVHTLHWGLRQQRDVPLWQLRVSHMLLTLLEGDASPAKLNCNDFSELIRIIGTWLENGGGYSHGLGIKDFNKAYRTGIQNAKEVSNPQEDMADFLRCLIDLRTKYGALGTVNIPAPEMARLATFFRPAILDQQRRDKMTWGNRGPDAPRMRTVAPAGTSYAIPDHVSDWWVRPSEAGRRSGRQVLQASGNDMCKRIDLLFGLLVGTTISGTTTDTVFVLEAFGQQQRLHAGYYMFPVATIAAGLHHTLLETALALTLTGSIDTYKVGYYKTLIPKGGLPAELAGVESILADGESATENRHFIAWYDGNEARPAGCVLWNKKYELQDAKRLVEAKGLMKHVMTLPPVPGKKDVARFIRLMAPRLLAYLPQDFQ